MNRRLADETLLRALMFQWSPYTMQFVENAWDRVHMRWPTDVKLGQ